MLRAKPLTTGPGEVIWDVAGCRCGQICACDAASRSKHFVSAAGSLFREEAPRGSYASISLFLRHLKEMAVGL